MKKYRVMYTAYSNKYGYEVSGYFYIQEQKKFLWWTIWKKITETHCGYGDNVEVVRKFSSEQEARDHIKELCKQVKPKGWLHREVDEVVCGE